MNSDDPILFLDIDGVLAPSECYFRPRESFWRKHKWAAELKVPYSFDALCVKVLNRILLETGADIVLTSDWKKKWDLDQLRIIFENNRVISFPIDITCNEIVSVDEHVGQQKNRAFQIGEYVTSRGLTNFAIVDDLDIYPYIPYEFCHTFVKVIEREGIKQTMAYEKIMKVFNEKKRVL